MDVSTRDGDFFFYIIIIIYLFLVKMVLMSRFVSVEKYIVLGNIYYSAEGQSDVFII